MQQGTGRPGSGAGGSERFLPDGESRRKLRRWRDLKDRFARYSVATFGVGVIAALALIFVYLFIEVLPMLVPAGMNAEADYAAPGGQSVATLHTDMDRHREVGVRYTGDHRVVFFRPGDSEILEEHQLRLPEDATVTGFGHAEPGTRLVVFGMDDGRALVARHAFNEYFSGGERRFDPDVEYPLKDGESVLLDVASEGTGINEIAIQRGSRGMSVAAALADGRLRLMRFEAKRSFISGEVTYERSTHELEPLPGGAAVTRILLDSTMSHILVGDNQGRLHYYDVSRPEQARLAHSHRVVSGEQAEVTALEYLLGTVSVIVGGSDGSVSQYMLVRDEDNNRHITRIRSFEAHEAPVRSIAPEHGRKGFATADEAGTVKLHYATSHRTLASLELASEALVNLAVAPRANALFAVDARGRFYFVDVRNPHPEVSLGALWQRVWYEGRSEPRFVWQSSSATDEFEPKFSLVPLTLGTVKAAFYAMLFAMPLAILGAVYSAYFMSPRMRGVVKPTIEVMEALPTVILGFLAGLWFAPFVENHIPAVFSVLVLMPLMLVGAAWIGTRGLPQTVREMIPEGWEAALLVPVVLLAGWFSVLLSPQLELLLFDGNMRQWLTNIGITYDQRNALVVGVAMGFAVIPTIYSIAEDAVFNVPRHLTQGSLALGATPWQTVTRVVLLTASPGIFSAVMIGFGRAVGETMIVLMATGNSPVLNFNIFEGMRTLSANIAVEIPEAAVGSTHFRILFLAALVLFILTFALNTAAEIVRNRLRQRYSAM